MNSIPTPPSTEDGIKRLAKTIKRESGIRHTEALNQAARLAGFENYHHARRAIANSAAGHSQLHRIFLTAYWRERINGVWSAGRETLGIDLPQTLSAIITRYQVQYTRNLKGFKMEYADHLEVRSNADSQENARKSLNGAARTLRFMEATSLRPATTQRQFEAMRLINDLPSRDHLSHWIDPTTGDWLVLDEPYEHVTESSAKRDQWVQAQGLYMAAPEWEGLYYPGRCGPHLISPNESLLRRIVKIVQAAPKSSVPPEWSGESASYFLDFVSPEREASGKARKSRPGTTYSWQKGATPYWSAPGHPSLWRPEKPMPVEIHMMIGPLLHGLCNSALPLRAARKLGHVRSTLEDWATAEHGQAITLEMSNRMYYGKHVEPIKAQGAKLDAIARVRAALLSGYEDCKPRREIIAVLDAATAGIPDLPAQAKTNVMQRS